ncbi:hypothetical protein EGW08_015232, partial [Elysia chlorotica]
MELEHAKSHLKNTMQNFDEPESISIFFKSCFKKSKDMQIWTPSKDILKQELIAASNALTVYIAVKTSMKYDRLPEFERMEQLIHHNLNRGVSLNLLFFFITTENTK